MTNAARKQTTSHLQGAPDPRNRRGAVPGAPVRKKKVRVVKQVAAAKPKAKAKAKAKAVPQREYGAQLTAKEVAAIRKRLKREAKQSVLAREYQVPVGIIGKIAKGETYTAIYGQPKSNQQRGRMSRQKGKQYQKYVCDVLAQRFNLPPEELYSAMAGVTGSDATLSRAARKKWPYSTEVKNCRTINMRGWLAQAERDGKKEGIPFALIFKVHKGQRDYVCLDLQELLKLL